MVPLPSSDTSSAPSCATATPTGRPHTSESLITNPGRKTLVFPRGYPVLETNTDDLVAGAPGPVPRAMLGCKTVTEIFGWKCVAIVERKSKRGRVRLDENIRDR